MADLWSVGRYIYENDLLALDVYALEQRLIDDGQLVPVAGLSEQGRLRRYYFVFHSWLEGMNLARRVSEQAKSPVGDGSS